MMDIVHNEVVVMVMNITSYKIYFLIISPKNGDSVSDWVSYEVCELLVSYYPFHLLRFFDWIYNILSSYVQVLLISEYFKYWIN
jgi:hypothetical protein